MSKGIPCSVSCASRVAVQFGAFEGSLFYLVHVKGRWFCLSDVQGCWFCVVYFMSRWFCVCQKSLFPLVGCVPGAPGSVWCVVNDRWFCLVHVKH